MFPTAMTYALPFQTTSTKAIDFAKRAATFTANWRQQARSSLGLNNDLQFAGFWFQYTEIFEDKCDNLIYS